MKKSPFPGMDPYLESRWPEVHARLIVYAANEMNRALPNDLQASIEESLAVYAENEESRGIRPDLHVQEDFGITDFSTPESATAVAEPVVVKRAPHPQRHVEIVGRDGRVITAIEFVSPWNKVGSRAREQYTRKQLDYMAAGINLVEIDLVRQGKYVLASALSDVPPQHRTPYMICVFRDIYPDQFEIYPAPLQQSLPTISIPLRPDEPDVALPLQKLLDDCYRDGRYYRINYRVPPEAKFQDDDRAWLESRLQEHNSSS